MSEQLKPCPFCGGKAVSVVTAQNTANPKYRVQCQSCGCSTPSTVCSPEHIDKWNRRVNE